MATIKLGAIVTEVAGSVGGTTFRRFKNGTVMQNKQFGASSNKLLKNKALPVLSKIIRGWSVLPLATRNEWSAQSLIFQFFDKFGKPKYLSGRELYIKLQSQATFSGQASVDPFTLSSITPSFDIALVNLDSTPKAEVVMAVPFVNGTLSIQVERIANSSVGFDFSRREILKSFTVVSQINFDFTTEFYNKYPYPQEGQYYNIYIFSSNSSGFRSQLVGVQSVIVG